jgi:hypothetical protein
MRPAKQPDQWMSAISHLDFDRPGSGPLREDRTRRLVRAEMADERGVTQDVVIRNLSSRGIGVSAREFAPVRDERVTLTLPGNEVVSGVVRWVNELTFGIELERDLNLAALANAMQRHIQRTNQQGKWEVRAGHRVQSGAVDPSKLRIV